MVLGIPWEIDTEGLREYMTKFGGLEDCIVMKVSPLFFFKKGTGFMPMILLLLFFF